jgi:hypothetical protein
VRDLGLARRCDVNVVDPGDEYNAISIEEAWIKFGLLESQSVEFGLEVFEPQARSSREAIQTFDKLQTHVLPILFVK